MRFVRSFEKSNYEAKFGELTGRLHEETSVPTEPPLLLWCGSDDLCSKWFASNHEYWAKEIDLEVCLRRHAGQQRKYFVEWRNVEVLAILPHRCGEEFVAVLL